MKERLKNLFSKEYMGLAGIVIIGILLYFLLSHFSTVAHALGKVLEAFSPFLWGLVIAYFVNFIVRWLEKKPLKKIENLKKQRIISVILAYIIAIVIVTLCILIIVPQTIESLSTLADKFPLYARNVIYWTSAFVSKHSWAAGFSTFITDQTSNLETWLPNLVTEYVVPYTVSLTTGAIGTIINIFVAVIVSIYFVSSKEKFYAQSKKVLYAHFNTEKVDKGLKLADMSNEIFSGFISGKLLDSLIIGVLAFIILSIFNFPFAMLVAVIIGITNIIPFLGPIIGAVPSFLIIFIISPVKAMWFLVFILILQQIDGNIIGPKILGFSVGISAFWIIVAVVLGNEFLGFIGMVIGVPLFAICYRLFKEYTEKKLKAKSLPTETKDFASEKYPLRFK